MHINNLTEPQTIDGARWFTGAGLGLFVHWDHTSQQGIEIGWPIVGTGFPDRANPPEDPMTVEKYHRTAATFDPTEWDATALARLAKQAGARYAVFTARHHGGYDMFHSEHSDYGIKATAFGRDVTREYVDAIRAEGIRVGIYYSLPDWHHPDYPAFTDEDLPYPRESWPKSAEAQRAYEPPADRRHRRSSPEAWSRYLDYVRGQLTELLTSYGQIDLLWFDGDWERSATEWEADELRRHIKSLQPDVVINDRLPGAGDYATPEQGFPLTTPDGPWELCMTIGDVWAYAADDTRYKSTRYLLTTLIDVVSRGGNFLLNVGPSGEGALNPEHVSRLVEIGAWLGQHGESIFDVVPTTGVDVHLPTTARQGSIYLHLVMEPVEELVVRGLPINRVTRVRRLADGLDLEFTSSREATANKLEDVPGEIRIAAPTPSGALIDVLAIDVAEPATG